MVSLRGVSRTPANIKIGEPSSKALRQKAPPLFFSEGWIVKFKKEAVKRRENVDEVVNDLFSKEVEGLILIPPNLDTQNVVTLNLAFTPSHYKKTGWRQNYSSIEYFIKIFR